MKKIYHVFLLLICIMICIASISANYFSGISTGVKRMYSTSSLGLPYSGFTIGLNNAACWYPMSFTRSPILSYMKDLHFNYTLTSDNPHGTDSTGLWGTSLNQDQVDYTNLIINKLAADSINYAMQRVKIELPCYGQRLVYEIQNGSSYLSGTDISPLNDGFIYQYNVNNYTVDSSRTVLHMNARSDAAGIIAKDIFENIQHVDFEDFLSFTSDRNMWRFKPMMRIKTNDFNDTSNTVVIEIRVYNYPGNLVKTILVKVKDFAVNGNNTSYNGQYIERYNESTPLEIFGDTLAQGQPSDVTAWPAGCKVDFKIYWPGNVDVWFDKLTVDDNIADSLFRGKIDGEIGQEANAPTLLLLQKNFLYCVDEMSYSNLACIKYVQDKYRALNNAHDSIKMNFAPNQFMFAKGMKNPDIAINRFFHDIQPVSFNLDIHFIPHKYPNNMTILSGPVYQREIVSAGAEDYNKALQFNMGDRGTHPYEYTWGSFVHQMAVAKTAADNNVTSFHSYFTMQPQIQAYFVNLEQDSHMVWIGVREPLNEEVQMQSMLSLAHGADGLDWYAAYSLNTNFSTTPGSGDVTLGLFNISQTDPTYASPRTYNMFNQNKYDYIKNMNAKLMLWKPWLDRIKWQAGYSIHYEPTSAFTRYISNIKSLQVYPDNQDKFIIGGDSDIAAEKFWEIGYFDPDASQSINANDHSKYFLLSNRRCFPTKGNHPEGVRGVQIKFNKDNLPGFNNWRITDITTGNSKTFNKNTSNGSYISFGNDSNSIGFFNPGEGKLFRLQPVMETGGILDGDENVTASSFNCAGMVYSRGKNISITGNISINFDSTAGIKMGVGKLKIGPSSTAETSDIVTLKSIPGKKWQGIICDTCSLVFFNQVNFKDLQDTSTFIKINNSDTLVCNLANFYCAQSSSNHPNGININTSGIKVSHNNITSSVFNMSPASIYGVNLNATGSSRSVLFMNYVSMYASQATMNSRPVIVIGSEGIIKNCIFAGFPFTITTAASDIHLYNNKFLGYGEISTLTALSYSNIFSGQTDSYGLAGYNKFDYSYGEYPMSNIYLDGATIDLKNGNNLFYTVNEFGEYHIQGITSRDETEQPVSGNCFLYGNSSLNPNPIDPVYDLYNSNMDPVSLSYTMSEQCDPGSLKELAFITDMGNGIFDTIFYKGYGEGGGEPSNKAGKHTESVGAATELHNLIEKCLQKKSS